MGRSVSTHRHAVATVYLHPEFENNNDGDTYEWDSFVEDLQENVLKPRYLSLVACNRWQDRENHVIMENSHVEVSVSEYCGCVAVCLAPRDAYDNFKAAFAERMADNFEKHIQRKFKSCAMRPIARFGNGEIAFQKI